MSSLALTALHLHLGNSFSILRSGSLLYIISCEGETSWSQVLFSPPCLHLWSRNYSAFLTWRYLRDNALKTFRCCDIFTKGPIQLSGAGKYVIFYCRSLVKEFFSNHCRRFCIVEAPFKHDCKTSRPREKDISAALIKDILAKASCSFSGDLYVSNSVSDNHIDSCWWFPCLSWNTDII